jgi:hypothetical protein
MIADMNAFFCNNLRDSEKLPGSKLRRGGHGRIPDFRLSVVSNGFEVSVFLAEIKTTMFMTTCKEEEPGFIKK